MHPHQYPPSAGWPPDPSWPAEPPPTPGARPASMVPLAIGAAAAGIAALAFLAEAVMALLVFANGAGDNDDSAIIPVAVLVETSVVTALLLAYSIGLIVARRDAGRSGIVWIAAAALPWTVLVPLGVAVVADDNREVLSDRLITVTTAVTLGSALLALLGLVTAMIFLGIPPGRRWLAGRVLARTEPLWPPAPLLAARKRFTLAAVLGMGGGAAQLVLTPLLTSNDDSRDTALAVMAVVLVVLVAVPGVLAWVGSRLALGGRRGGAHLARAVAVFLLYGIQPFMLLGVLNGLAVVFDNEDATLPPAVGSALAMLATAVAMLALVQFVAGLAALADPRSEVYLRSGGRRAT
ncbi:hypothetical protein GCM10009557_27030 [Virgisporangium ochraceum]